MNKIEQLTAYHYKFLTKFYNGIINKLIKSFKFTEGDISSYYKHLVKVHRKKLTQFALDSKEYLKALEECMITSGDTSAFPNPPKRPFLLLYSNFSMASEKLILAKNRKRSSIF